MRALLAILALLLPSSAFGQAGRIEFDKGMRYFRAQEYDAALPYLQQAYELSGKRPSTIRALAQCERALNRYEDAIRHFEEYLATNPEDAASVRETITLVKELQQERERRARETPAIEPPKVPPPPPPAPPIAPPPPPAPESDDDVHSSPYLWVGIAAGVAAVIGGGIALGVALSGERDPYGGSSDVVLEGP